jgi:broad specificity phosphatase PhoE
MLTLVLTRHGLTDRSVPEQHLGQHIDISINDAGRRQAQALARRLAPVAFDRVITSPLFRARETAELVVPGAAIEADPRLREMDYGAWEGRTTAEVEAADPGLRRDWELAPDRIACPGGESASDVADRLRAFLGDLLDEHRAWAARAQLRAATSGAPPSARVEQRVLAVGHGTANRILLCVATGVAVGTFRRRFVQGQANLTVLRWPAGADPEDALLVTMNDLAHLRPRDAAPWG